MQEVYCLASQVLLVLKNLPANVGNADLIILGLERSPGRGHGNPLQCSCLENLIEEPGGLQSMGSGRTQRVGYD